MSAEQFSAVAGLVLSLAFSYIPGLNEWFASKDSTTKRGLTALILLAIAFVAFGASCANLLAGLPITITCSQGGAVTLLFSFIAALSANQATFLLSPKPKNVEQATEAARAAADSK